MSSECVSPNETSRLEWADNEGRYYIEVMNAKFAETLAFLNLSTVQWKTVSHDPGDLWKGAIIMVFCGPVAGAVLGMTLMMLLSGRWS